MCAGSNNFVCYLMLCIGERSGIVLNLKLHLQYVEFQCRVYLPILSNICLGKSFVKLTLPSAKDVIIIFCIVRNFLH